MMHINHYVGVRPGITELTDIPASKDIKKNVLRLSYIAVSTKVLVFFQAARTTPHICALICGFPPEPIHD